MKKFLLTVAVAIATFFCNSCDNKVGILYNVNIDGKAAGDVVVTFPNGKLDLDGAVNLAFVYSNDTTVVSNNCILLSNALESNDKEVRNFANTVNNEFDVRLKNPEVAGSYDVKIYGYAKETATGIVIAVNKEFKYPSNE